MAFCALHFHQRNLHLFALFHYSSAFRPFSSPFLFPLSLFFSLFFFFSLIASAIMATAEEQVAELASNVEELEQLQAEMEKELEQTTKRLKQEEAQRVKAERAHDDVKVRWVFLWLISHGCLCTCL
jgi:predicted ATP-grasp superfamily ATP-dependent carboligase